MSTENAKPAGAPKKSPPKKFTNQFANAATTAKAAAAAPAKIGEAEALAQANVPEEPQANSPEQDDAAVLALLKKQEAEEAQANVAILAKAAKTGAAVVHSRTALKPGQGRAFDKQLRKYVLHREDVIASMLKFNPSRYERA